MYYLRVILLKKLVGMALVPYPIQNRVNPLFMLINLIAASKTFCLMKGLKGQSWLLFGSLVSFVPWALGVVIFQLKFVELGAKVRHTT